MWLWPLNDKQPPLYKKILRCQVGMGISKMKSPKRSPNLSFQWNHHDRDIIVICPSDALRNIEQLVKIHTAASKKHVRTRKFKVTHHGIDMMHTREGSIQLKSNAWIIHRHVFPHFQTRENYELNRQNINTLCKKVKGFSPRITRVREWIMQTAMENKQKRKKDSSAHQHNIELIFPRVWRMFSIFAKRPIIMKL